MGPTDKNKRFLRQFDDPAVLRRLYALPDRLLAASTSICMASPILAARTMSAMD
jgi:hypothetical protein